MSFWDSLSHRFSAAARAMKEARAAEARGDLARAAEAFAAANAPEEAARIMIVRGDGEPDPRARLRHFTQAATTAPEGSATRGLAVKKRAKLLLALAGDATVSPLARHEVVDVARELEAVGEASLAADAYRRAGDVEGEARALQAAGDVDRLEHLLAMQQTSERAVRTKETRLREVDVLLRSGRRREALVTLEELERAEPGDLSIRQRASALRAQRATTPVVTVELGGAPLTLVLGDVVVVGRTEGAIRVPSNAVSREHLRVGREADAIVVRDLGSRNGTQLRGMNLAGAVPVTTRTELLLGREVPVVVGPSDRLPGAVSLEIAGADYTAPLGPTRLPGLPFALRPAPDGWLELDTGGAAAFLGEVELAPNPTLLVGDAIGIARGGPPVLRIASTSPSA